MIVINLRTALIVNTTLGHFVPPGSNVYYIRDTHNPIKAQPEDDILNMITTLTGVITVMLTQK